jgi:hypothetical protein
MRCKDSGNKDLTTFWFKSWQGALLVHKMVPPDFAIATACKHIQVMSHVPHTVKMLVLPTVFPTLASQQMVPHLVSGHQAPAPVKDGIQLSLGWAAHTNDIQETCEGWVIGGAHRLSQVELQRLSPCPTVGDVARWAILVVLLAMEADRRQLHHTKHVSSQ